jgi:DNA-directed RNA polymerase I subunit RPA1
MSGNNLSTDSTTAVVIRQEISGVKFGFYDDDDVVSRSVVQVVSPVAFDALGNYLKGGLYDPRLGPINPEESCKTCGNPYLYCPGHTGHIALAVPVYHIFTFPHLLKLLRAKCFHCHRFRISKSLCKAYAAKLHLLDCGYVEDALALDDQISHTLMKTDKSSSPSSTSAAAVVEEYLDSCLQRTKQETGNISSYSSSQRHYRHLWIKQFLSANNAQKKCATCNAFNPKIRHDSYNKIFMSSLSDKLRKSNYAERVPTMKPALKQLKTTKTYQEGQNYDDNDDDSGWESDESVNTSTSNPHDVDYNVDGDDVDRMMLDTAATATSPSSSKKKNADRFMHALEIEAQVKLTWKKHTFICSKIFGPIETVTTTATNDMTNSKDNGHNEYKIFFMRAIPVPPSRFRPPMAMGAMVTEHAQNHYLSKMIDLNTKILQQLTTIQQYTVNEDSIDINDTATEKEKQGKSIEKAKELLYQSWIDLQTTVNCYIDSSKDPEISVNSANIGIKQILEKKEGLFRK